MSRVPLRALNSQFRRLFSKKRKYWRINYAHCTSVGNLCCIKPHFRDALNGKNLWKFWLIKLIYFYTRQKLVINNKTFSEVLLICIVIYLFFCSRFWIFRIRQWSNFVPRRWKWHSANLVICKSGVTQKR